MAGYLDLCEARPAARQRILRFDRIAVTSVFGDPLSPITWSGAPFRLASALRRIGVAVEGFQPKLGRARRATAAIRHLATGFGALRTSELLMRGAPARDQHANEIAAFAASRGIRNILHTGTLDLPAFDLLHGVKHYLYCDHTWSLALPRRPDAAQFSEKARNEYERLEHELFLGLEHIFTFGTYVRDEIIHHYGVPADRVTAVGSGMGEIDPFYGSRPYTAPNLLFIAKHLFKAKGGELLADAFSRARRKNANLTLTVVGDKRSRKYLPRDSHIIFHGRLPWAALQRLYRSATLLAQPMLNDPWGQVYLEALVSRTPVLGLDRHGLPEIVEGGRHGFLVANADAAELAEALLDALSSPDRLAAMGCSGQHRVMNSYSWDRVAERIAFI